MSIKTQATKVAKAAKASVITKADVKEAVAGARAFKQPQPVAEYGELQTVTSMRLKRREVISPYYGKFYMPDSMYVWLNQLGISMGVTWDEVLRGLCEQHRASNDPTGGLRLFVPALN